MEDDRIEKFSHRYPYLCRLQRDENGAATLRVIRPEEMVDMNDGDQLVTILTAVTL
jgi:hypothetical protein